MRERERQRDRETERDRQRQRDRERDRETEEQSEPRLKHKSSHTLKSADCLFSEISLYCSSANSAKAKHASKCTVRLVSFAVAGSRNSLTIFIGEYARISAYHWPKSRLLSIIFVTCVLGSDLSRWLKKNKIKTGIEFVFVFLTVYTNH